MEINNLWQNCLDRLESQIPATDFNIWLRPLQIDIKDEQLFLLAPNRFVMDHINEKFFQQIVHCIQETAPGMAFNIQLTIRRKSLHHHLPLNSQRNKLIQGKILIVP